MKEQNNFEDYIKMNNITVGIEVTEMPSYIPTVIDLTDSQLELIKSIGNHYYNSKETCYSLPFLFKHIEGNKFEIILITKNNKEK